MIFLLCILPLSLFAQERITVRKIDNIPVEKLTLYTDSNKSISTIEVNKIKTIYDYEIKSIEIGNGLSSIVIESPSQDLVRSIKKVGGDGTGGGITLSPKGLRTLKSLNSRINKVDLELLKIHKLENIKSIGGDGTGGG
tara:strand:+ start:4391 stop:4807 length:417 start_codon:yes stop_codon:yes gene_type:complete